MVDARDENNTDPYQHDIQLKLGAVDVGGILTETYTRKSKLSDEAKEDLGLDPREDYDASIGIGSVEEYVVMSIRDVAQGATAYFDLSQFEQALLLKSLFIDNANQDEVVIEVQTSAVTPSGDTWVTLLTQTFKRNKTPVLFPDAPLPPTVRLKITAKTYIGYMQLAFKPCAIIATAYGTLDGGNSAT